MGPQLATDVVDVDVERIAANIHVKSVKPFMQRLRRDPTPLRVGQVDQQIDFAP